MTLSKKENESIFDFDVISIMGLVFSILGICGTFIPFIGFFFPLISGLMSVFGLNSKKFKGFAIVGIIISTIALIISICFTIIGIGNIILAEK